MYKLACIFVTAAIVFLLLRGRQVIEILREVFDDFKHEQRYHEEDFE